MGLPEERAQVTRLGRYELITMIGQGGMAEVHLAVQRGPGGFEKLVVVKLVHRHLAKERAFVDMLLDEGRLAGMIKHPNVVDIYDLGQADGRYYVAMEYLDGEPLLSILRTGADGDRLDPLSTARVIADTAEGLEAAHRLKSRDGKPLGLVHHDVSLGNIVVLYSGVVKLVDFGVAKARSSDAADRIQGKPSYMAPEKLTEGAEVDRRSDIWSLGVVAWEALTLTRLFKGDDDADTIRQVREAEIIPPSRTNPEVPRDFDPIVMRALERDVDLRYSTAKAFALDLEEVLRKRGYSGKNDRITRYMERTFAKQIAARERLLADLTEGRTSEVLEASINAFREAATSTITSTGDNWPVVRASDLVIEEAPVRTRMDPSWSDSHRAAGIKGLQAWVDESRRRRPFPWKWVAPVAAAALVLAIILIAKRDGADPDRAAPTLARAAAPAPSPVPVASEPPVAVDAPPADESLPGGSNEAPEPVVAPADPSGATGDLADDPVDDPTDDLARDPADDVIEMAPVSAKRPAPPRRPRPTGDVETLYARGLEELSRGDAKAALAALTDARRVDPSFAPAWYGLGLVQERLGNRRAARSAYQRYLALSPRAANAPQVRARIDRL